MLQQNLNSISINFKPKKAKRSKQVQIKPPPPKQTEEGGCPKKIPTLPKSHQCFCLCFLVSSSPSPPHADLVLSLSSISICCCWFQCFGCASCSFLEIFELGFVSAHSVSWILIISSILLVGRSKEEPTLIFELGFCYCSFSELNLGN